jgi:acetyl-CoA carboxylase/biotin carboxylase 1
LFASGSSREDASKALILSLKELEVRGDIRTTVEYLVQLLETDAFKENTIDTSWLDGLIKAKAVHLDVDPHIVALSVAVYRAQRHCHNEEKKIIDNFSKGQISLQGLETAMTFPVEVSSEEILSTQSLTR